MRSISRVADVSINTVSKLLVDAGKACAAFHDEKVRGVKAKRVQVDEIWSFTAAKQKNVARFAADRADLRLDKLIRAAERALQHVAARMRARLVFGDLAVAEQPADVGVVVGAQLHDPGNGRPPRRGDDDFRSSDRVEEGQSSVSADGALRLLPGGRGDCEFE